MLSAAPDAHCDASSDCYMVKHSLQAAGSLSSTHGVTNRERFARMLIHFVAAWHVTCRFEPASCGAPSAWIDELPLLPIIATFHLPGAMPKPRKWLDVRHLFLFLSILACRPSPNKRRHVVGPLLKWQINKLLISHTVRFARCGAVGGCVMHITVTGVAASITSPVQDVSLSVRSTPRPHFM